MVIILLDYLSLLIIDPNYEEDKISSTINLCDIAEKNESLSNICFKCKIKNINVYKISITHCIICDYCIFDYNHHCFWVNKCIGKKNLYLFYAFLYLLITLFMVVIYECYEVINLDPENLNDLTYSFIFNYLNLTYDKCYSVTIFILCFSIIFTFPILYLIIVHMHNEYSKSHLKKVVISQNLNKRSYNLESGSEFTERLLDVKTESNI